MNSSCHSTESRPETDASHCSANSSDTNSCHPASSRPDYLLWISGSIVVLTYLLNWSFGDSRVLPEWLATLSYGVFEMLNTMWWGLLIAIVFVGLLHRIPRELVMSILGRGDSSQGIIRATFAGVLLDLCSHGILMVGSKLYERGASLGQLMAFLIASPWNSLSLTVILISLIGVGWTLTYLVLSMVIGIASGLVFDRLVANGKLPANPYAPTAADGSAPTDSIASQFSALIKSADVSLQALAMLLWDGVRGSRMVFRWLLFGIVLAAMIRAFVPVESYQALFGPTVAGLLLTLLAATIIEVCSEGSTPIAADIVTRAGAPGNGFTFLMAGVSTDYTEVMVLKDVTRSWKIALFLPLVTLPQILVLGWVLNQFA